MLAMQSFADRKMFGEEERTKKIGREIART